ncbi:MAG: competence protein ComE [Fischerella sp.]|jgi:hypothetical protein|uniref:competence protein ComE n=1 Tax=Fischerella sp. TaxID=1191 RepID=UPI0017AF27C0|nr:competence protein ComE [Fischerella sp.]NWF61926.1 competence protein ComE [Fischerella sp.]
MANTSSSGDSDKEDKAESKGNPGEEFTPLGGGAYMSKDSGDVVESKDIVPENEGNQSNGSSSK